MPRLVYSSEKHGQGATIELDSKEVVVCSIAQMGVLVFLYNNKSLIGSILSNFWGARLYKQSDVYKNARTAEALSELYPDVAEPLRNFKIRCSLCLLMPSGIAGRRQKCAPS